MLIHENPNIFPEPFSFKPERWLEADKDMDKYLVAFGKGPRICLGLKYDLCIFTSAPSYTDTRAKYSVYFDQKLTILLYTVSRTRNSTQA